MVGLLDFLTVVMMIIVAMISDVTAVLCYVCWVVLFMLLGFFRYLLKAGSFWNVAP
jgi:hypothetical protein